MKSDFVWDEPDAPNALGPRRERRVPAFGPSASRGLGTAFLVLAACDFIAYLFFGTKALGAGVVNGDAFAIVNAMRVWSGRLLPLLLFSMWWIARGRRGAVWLLWAAICDAAELVVALLLPQLMPRWFDAAQSYVFAIAVMLGASAFVFLGIGITRSRMAPAWIGWFGLLLGVAGAVDAFLRSAGFGATPSGLWLFSLLNGVFLAVLGISLWRRPVSTPAQAAAVGVEQAYRADGQKVD